MALDAPPMRSMARRTTVPGVARRYAGLAVCGGVVALVLAAGINEARRPLPPQAASVLATEPITAPTPPATVAVAPAPVPLATTVPVPVATTAVAVAAAPEPVVAATTVTFPEPVFSLGQLCWPLGASARTATGAPIMCTRLDPAGVAYTDGHARWRRT